jgi:NAD+ synthase
MNFTRDSLTIDAAAETERMVTALRKTVRQELRRFGGVVGISGGIDSAVVLALAVRAFGPEKVVAVMMPERDSDPVSEQLARELAARCGVTPILENITPVLEGFRCYERRDAAIRRVVPEYDAAAGWKAKIVLPQNLLDGGTLNTFSVTAIAPDGRVITKPLPPAEFLQIVAASNFKQRTRMAMVYYHAEVKNYAVLGTANKNEFAQGFFVKYGDGGVDVQTIGHLYKTQVYQLAAHLGVPEAIRQRTPTTDTYSAPCNQEEFFFRLPFATMDLLWFAQEQGVSPEETARVMDLTPDQVRHAFDDFTRKERGTAYLRRAPAPL